MILIKAKSIILTVFFVLECLIIQQGNARSLSLAVEDGMESGRPCRDFYEYVCKRDDANKYSLTNNLKDDNIYSYSTRQIFEEMEEYMRENVAKRNPDPMVTKLDDFLTSCRNRESSRYTINDKYLVYEKLFDHKIWKGAFIDQSPTNTTNLSDYSNNSSDRYLIANLTEYFGVQYHNNYLGNEMNWFEELLLNFDQNVVGGSLFIISYNDFYFTVKPPQLPLTRFKYYQRPEVIKNYKLYLLKVTSDLAFTQQDIDDIIKLQTDIARLPEESLHNQVKQPFQSVIPKNTKIMNFSRIIENLCSNCTHMDLDVEYMIKIDDYLSKYLLNPRGFEILNKYLMVVSIDKRINFFSPDYQKARDPVCPYIPKCEYLSNNPMFCYTLTKNLLPDLVDHVYNQSIGHFLDLSGVHELYYSIKESTIDLIKKSPWMDAGLMKNLSEVVEAVDLILIEPNSTKTFTEDLTQKYDKIHFRRDSFYENFKSVIMLSTQKLNYVYPSSQYLGFDIYFDGKNINYQLGLLREPFYKPGDKTINYGGIGDVFGHEITHAVFDYLLENVLKINDSNQISQRVLEERMNCLKGKYSYFTSQMKSDLEMITHEYFADEEGLKISYLAWQKSLNSSTDNRHINYPKENEKFFENFAKVYCHVQSEVSLDLMNIFNEHLPDNTRVIVPLQGYEPFNKEYGCTTREKSVCTGIL